MLPADTYNETVSSTSSFGGLARTLIRAGFFHSAVRYLCPAGLVR